MPVHKIKKKFNFLNADLENVQDSKRSTFFNS